MIGIDTNILVRFLTRDDPVQSVVAHRIMVGLSPDEPGYASVAVVVELAWVLQSSYAYGQVEIADAIELLLRAPALVVENEQEVAYAISDVRANGAAFTDAFIAALGAKAGCSRTLTFDKRAARLPGFELAQ